MSENSPLRSNPRPHAAALCCLLAAAFGTSGSRICGDEPAPSVQLTPPRSFQPAPANRPENPEEPSAFELTSGLTVSQRRFVNALSRAQTFIEQGLYADAVPLLQAVLDGAPNAGYRVMEGESGLLRNLCREAERTLGAMPLEGLIAYDLSSGSAARQLLEEARTGRDADRLLETSRRFFHTDAGHQATYLLGMLHLDRNRPFEAALCFDRELHALDVSGRDPDSLFLHSAIAWNLAGFDDRALQRLRELHQRAPEFQLRLRGGLIPLPAPDEDALIWLRETIGPHTPPDHPLSAWALTGGNPARTAAANRRVVEGELAWSIPTSSWQVPRDETPFATGILDVSRQIGGIERDYLKSDLPPISQVRPLIVAGRAVVRTPTSLRAIDLASGDVLWEAAHDNVPDRILTGEIEPLPGDRGSILDPLLKDRIFLNAAYGTLSADANCVFCVERMGMPADNSISYTSMRNFSPSAQGRPHPLSSQTDSELSAYALRDGRRVWTVGGNGRQFPERQLAGGYFLGPPLPLGGQLFGIAEFERRVVLYALGAADGNLQWSLTLQEFELDVSRDPDRARAGLSPSFADGLLICPTGSGVVVAVDVSTRQLIWSARYRPLTPEATSSRARAMLMARIAARRGIPSPPPRIEARWLDSLAMISGNRVILTPLDADKLLCLDLHDGTLIWEQPRNDSLFIGGIRDDSLIVVGSSSVEQLSLETGHSIKTPTVPIPRPAGRGLLDGDVYYLPLRTGEIVAIDLPANRITSHVKLLPAAPPGNLVAAGDDIIMQSPTALSKFAAAMNRRD